MWLIVWLIDAGSGNPGRRSGFHQVVNNACYENEI